MNKIVQTVVVCGNGINAHSIVQTVKRLQFKGHIVLLRQSCESRGLAECLNNDVEHWAVDLTDVAELPKVIDNRFGDSGCVAVLFTDERYHQAFLEWQTHRPESSLLFYVGSSGYLQEILDRYLFYQFILSRKLASVPHTICGNEDPFPVFGDAFIVRPRLSWFGLKQRERVTLVRNKAEFDRAIRSYSSRGLELGDLSFQEQLSIRNQDNVSVCGWYSSSRRHIYCTRKILQYPPETGGGDLVERIPDNDDLIGQAADILSAMSYEGPFEMEFVFDLKRLEFNVTELNPRFWLQHGLIEVITGGDLAGCYLGIDSLLPGESDRRARFWINPLYMLFRSMRLDFRSLRAYLSDESWSPLTLSGTFRYILFLAAKNLAGLRG